MPIAPNGDTVTVERLVMQIMKHEYEEGTIFESVSDVEKSQLEIIATSRFQHMCGDWIGWHSEGSILRSLYAMLMWDELFEVNVDDVFQTKYQEAPLDLYADCGLFYSNRLDSA
jgi:hypothetical protein